MVIWSNNKASQGELVSHGGHYGMTDINNGANRVYHEKNYTYLAKAGQDCKIKTAQA